MIRVSSSIEMTYWQISIVKVLLWALGISYFFFAEMLQTKQSVNGGNNQQINT